MADLDLIAWDESTPFTAEQFEKATRWSKICKLAVILREVLGDHFHNVAYEAISEKLIDRGVEVGVVHCGECKYLNKKVDCGGFCKCGEVNGGTPTIRVNWGYCDYGERRTENGG